MNEYSKLFGRDLVKKMKDMQHEAVDLINYQNSFVNALETINNNVFEVRNMGFGMALEALKNKAHIARSGWNGKNMWLCLNSIKCNNIESDLWIFIKTENGRFMPWSSTQADILANDWYVIDLDETDNEDE